MQRCQCPIRNGTLKPLSGNVGDIVVFLVLKSLNLIIAMGLSAWRNAQVTFVESTILNNQIFNDLIHT